jgi:hypothetical protein
MRFRCICKPKAEAPHPTPETEIHQIYEQTAK